MKKILICLAIVMSSYAYSSEKFDMGQWVRKDKHDGYVIGNGKMYSVVGLGKELTRIGKSRLSNKPVTLTRIAWVIGPHYTLGNLGYGWEIKPIINDTLSPWEKERIQVPNVDLPFWGIVSESAELTSQVTDLILPNKAVMLRRVILTRPEGSKPAHVKINIPVFPDERNAFYGMFNGKEVKGDIVTKWRDRCGENLKARESISYDKLQSIILDEKAIINVGANRALWQEISTTVPDDDIYKELFPFRALATTAICNNARISVEDKEIHVDLGEMKAGETKILGIWIVTTSGAKDQIVNKAVGKLAEWSAKDINEVINENINQSTKTIIKIRRKNDNTNILKTITACTDLVKANQAHAGGIMAQAYMYPMYYIRDQYGSFKFMLSLGEYKRAYKILQFYIGMQNRDGIQNAHDCLIEPPDPTYWHPDANAKNGLWQRAEVPSYIILMARDYLKYTDDIEKIRPLYQRLAYNLRVQKFNKNNLLPWAHDESYTNSQQTKPKFQDEMTDSNILFLAAAQFMTELAERLGNVNDAEDFRKRYEMNYNAVMERLWLPDKKYFAYARSESDDSNNIDTRPVLDALLRWTHVELGAEEDSVAKYCFDATMKNLLNPIRVVPEVFNFTAGMDPGYVLYALSRFQHPSMHDAAKLLTNYASDAGLFSEYYSHKDNVIKPFGGTLRPWESALCAHALLHYVIGLQIDMEEKRIFLQPHLPPEWDNWKTKKIELYNEGYIELSLNRNGNRIEFAFERYGGKNNIDVHIEFGGFAKKLKGLSKGFESKKGMSEILIKSFKVSPSKSIHTANKETLLFETN